MGDVFILLLMDACICCFMYLCGFITKHRPCLLSSSDQVVFIGS